MLWDIFGLICGIGVLTGVFIATILRRSFEEVFGRTGEAIALVIFGADIVARAVTNILVGM